MDCRSKERFAAGGSFVAACRLARPLGLIHRQVRVPENLLSATAVVGEHGDQTNAGTHPDVTDCGGFHLTIDRDRFCQCGVQPVGQIVDLCRFHGRRQQRDELVTSDTSDHVIGTQRVIEPLRRDLEDGVSGVMPQCVIDRFEVVEVDEKYCTQTVLSCSDEPGHLCEHPRAVGQPGQQIVGGLVQELAVGVVAFGDVDK